MSDAQRAKQMKAHVAARHRTLENIRDVPQDQVERDRMAVAEFMEKNGVKKIPSEVAK